MRKLLLFLLLFNFPQSVFSGNIQYGYNAKGEYVQKSIGGQKIDYGYNAKGQYVPKSYGK